MSNNHGKFCWYELMTTNTGAAKAFYGELIGWGTNPIPMGEAEYAMWTKPGSGEPMGGVMTLAEEAKAMGAPPHWMLSIAVDDVDGTASKAAGLGATVLVPPSPVPGFGRFSVLRDPSGAVFGIFKGEGDGGDNELPGVDESLGGVSWHELMTSDVDGALSFYSALFGWAKTGAMDMGPEMGTYQMYGHGSKSYGGMMKRPPEMPMSAWLPYFTVSNTGAVCERAKSLGGQIHHGPMEVPGGGLVAAGADPQGASFAVFQPPAKG